MRDLNNCPGISRNGIPIMPIMPLRNRYVIFIDELIARIVPGVEITKSVKASKFYPAFDGCTRRGVQPTTINKVWLIGKTFREYLANIPTR